jgi:hypothetical protein
MIPSTGSVGEQNIEQEDAPLSDKEKMLKKAV